MNVFEMEGFLRGKCLPGDMKVNETTAEYLVRKLSQAGELIAAHSTIEKAREVTNCPDGVDLQGHLKQLVAESVAMKSAAKEVLAHWAAAEPGEMEQMMDKCMPDLRVAYCETHATDSILRAAEARGVDKAIEHLLTKFVCTGHVGVPAMALEYLAKQLREGKAE